MFWQYSRSHLAVLSDSCTDPWLPGQNSRGEGSRGSRRGVGPMTTPVPPASHLVSAQHPQVALEKQSSASPFLQSPLLTKTALNGLIVVLPVNYRTKITPKTHLVVSQKTRSPVLFSFVTTQWVFFLTQSLDGGSQGRRLLLLLNSLSKVWNKVFFLSYLNIF